LGQKIKFRGGCAKWEGYPEGRPYGSFLRSESKDDSLYSNKKPTGSIPKKYKKILFGANNHFFISASKIKFITKCSFLYKVF
jgi:hypothetical protein